MIRRIIFLSSYYYFNQWDFERFGIELLLKNDFSVEVWDLIDVLYPGVPKPSDAPNWSGYRIFNDKEGVSDELKNLPSDTFVINLVPYSLATLWFYKALSHSQARYAVNMALALPGSEVDRGNRFAYYWKIRKGLNREKLLSHLRATLEYHFLDLSRVYLGIRPASLILASGEQCLHYHYPVNKSTEILWEHTFDYDLYLKERGISSIERPTAVFLDENYYIAEDNYFLGLKPAITTDRYYPSLARFFDYLEQKLGLKVVIAAHPGSHYDKLPDCFGGREWVLGRTIQLVKESRLVLAHKSTSLSFANLFHKPVLFLTSSELDKSRDGLQIRIMAGWFGKSPICIDTDTDIDWEQELAVSVSHYERYRRCYIKTGRSPDLPFWQIVANRLKEG